MAADAAVMALSVADKFAIVLTAVHQSYRLASAGIGLTAVRIFGPVGAAKGAQATTVPADLAKAQATRGAEAKSQTELQAIHTSVATTVGTVPKVADADWATGRMATVIVEASVVSDPSSCAA